MATQVTLFPFTGLPAPSGGEPTNHDNNGAGPVRVVIQDPGVDLAKKTVCIKMRLSTMGNIRKVSTSQIEADADKDLLRVSKHLLDSAELKAIGRFDGEIRRFLYNICLPFEIGIHLLPIAALETVEDRLRKFVEDRQALVTAFLSVYPGLCQDAGKRLRGLYNPADYPPVDEVSREFAERLAWGGGGCGVRGLGGPGADRVEEAQQAGEKGEGRARAVGPGAGAGAGSAGAGGHGAGRYGCGVR